MVEHVDREVMIQADELLKFIEVFKITVSKLLFLFSGVNNYSNEYF